MKNTLGTKLLRRFKKKYCLTWPEVAKMLGISVSRVQDMYSGKYQVPHYYVFFINIFLRHEEIYLRYKEYRHKDL